MISEEVIGHIDAMFTDLIATVTGELNQSKVTDREFLAKFGLEEEDLIENNLPHKSQDTLRLETKLKAITHSLKYFHSSLRSNSVTLKDQIEKQEEFFREHKKHLAERKATNDLPGQNLVRGCLHGHQEVIEILKFMDR